MKRIADVTSVDCYFVAPDGEKFTIRTTRLRDLRETYVIFVGGWKVKEYLTKKSVRDYIVKNNLTPVASRDGEETSARASRDCTLDWVTWANTPAL